MRMLPAMIAVLCTAFALAAPSVAPAQSNSAQNNSAQNVSPRQIQGLIANGQEQAALSELQAVLQANPNSGVAWYLTAEAQDAAGNEAAAGAALANAQRDAPGLPFAQPDEAAALQAHIAGAATGIGNGIAARRSGISPGLVGIIGVVIVFLLLRMFFRRRRFGAPGYPPGYGSAGGQGPFPYGPGSGYGPGGMGSGIGGALMGGLATGAGLAVGERVIDDVFGRNNNGFAQGGFPPDQNSGNGGIADRDDGLSGNPGWDDGSNNQNDNFDPGNSW